MKITIDNEVIHYNVQYGKGKKMQLQIDSIGFITVKAPNRTSDEAIAEQLQKWGSWILEKQNERDANKVSSLARKYEPNGTFLYLGEERSLHELIHTDNLTKEQLKLNLKKFYFTQCKTLIESRIKHYQKELKVTFKSIDIIESFRKWGSCNSNKKLEFNYRLAMAPVEVIDYVMIHELCHLTHMNHDRSFWRRVGSIMPDYKEKEAYLERMNSLMTL
ncbi:M48 family metallopeptidase [Sporosarcina aquimarina]|uniref:SprT family zinc-dependent metalloprotease n=1 Tax=Sporosarcina aquimarina TaxID=114975 RepID=A0ABU4G2A9_9BACL|nr:SprT family zinc-dependent metalloprotease [Sporosarcina aquimarina]MDW0111110.1 SprT family zinc-dependent metalloprotease [Sporosarcina aquimarina]